MTFAATFTDGDGWTLEYGDGQATNSTAGEVAETHTYGEGGTYEARLTVTNGGGSDSRTITITVEAASPSPS